MSTRGYVGERAESLLCERLRARRAEIEQSILTRVYAISNASGVTDPMYTEGLRKAISAAVSLGLGAVEGRDESELLPPPLLLGQARLAARHGVGLETVLRRYFAGHTLLGDFLIEEAARVGLEGAALQRLLRAQATLFDRLLAKVSEAHAEEAANRLAGSDERRGRHIERLLAGELVDTSSFAYDFDGFHLALVAVGPGAAKALHALVGGFECRLLLVRRGRDTAWAWLGSRRRLDPSEIEKLITSAWVPGRALAIGEPAHGLVGWRLSHRQARAASVIAIRRDVKFARYSDVALLASVAQDDLLATSLHDLYLRPLERERDSGEVARQTLKAYFSAGRNVSSAAAALGVSRQAVTNRLRTIEERLERPLTSCAADLEIALRADDLG